jgi:hypothetical protein
MTLEDAVRQRYGDLLWIITTLEVNNELAQKRIKELEGLLHDQTRSTPSD